MYSGVTNYFIRRAADFIRLRISYRERGPGNGCGIHFVTSWRRWRTGIYYPELTGVQLRGGRSNSFGFAVKNDLAGCRDAFWRCILYINETFIHQ